MLPESIPGGLLDTILGPLGTIFEAPFPRFGQKSIWRRFSGESLIPFGRLLGHLFGTFFFSGLRGTKKGGPGGPSKLDPFLDGCWCLPGGSQEGSRVHGSSIFTFSAGPQKGSKMGAKMERFGLPNPSYTHFGAPWVEK